MARLRSERFSNLKIDTLNILTQSEPAAPEYTPAIKSQSRPRLITIHPGQIIERSRLQTRRPFDPENDPEDQLFGESIQKYGVTQPVMIFRIECPGSEEACYGLITGHRRVDAALHNGMTAISALLVPPETSQQSQDLFHALENLQRKDLQPIEKAELIRALMDAYQYKQHEVAEAIGLSKSQVSSLLYLLETPEDVQEAVKAGLVGARNAREIDRMPQADRLRVYELTRAGIPFIKSIEQVTEQTESRPSQSESEPAPHEPDPIIKPTPKSKPTTHEVSKSMDITTDGSHPIRLLLGDSSARFLQITKNHRQLRQLSDSSRLLLALIWLDNQQDIEAAAVLLDSLRRPERRELERALQAIRKLSALQTRSRRMTALASAGRYLETAVCMMLE